MSSEDQENPQSKEQIKVIPVILSPALKETGIVKSFDINRSKKNVNIVIALNGKYDNKFAVSDLDRKSWSHSQKNMIEALALKGVHEDHINLLTDTLDNNYPRVYSSLDSLDDNEKDDSDFGKKESTKVLQLFDDLGVMKELFHDNLGSAYATVHVESERIDIDNHLETLPVFHSKFEKLVSRLYYQYNGRTLGGETLKEVCMNLGSRAEFDGQERELDIRVNSDKDKPLTYYYDLVNPKWEVIEVTPLGWSIKKHASETPTLFKRYPSVAAQVYPSTSKDYPNNVFNRFFDLLNIENNEDVRLLLKCYIISLFIPEISKVILVLQGPKGSAKTTIEWLIKLLVDPRPSKKNKPSLLTPPTSKEDFRQQISHNYVIYYDNIRYVKNWLSDCLCRAATGTTDEKRALYTNDETFIYEYLRCIGLNGINLSLSQADALDRVIIVGVERILSTKMRDFNEIMTEFEKLRPHLLAYIFDILVELVKMKAEGGIKLHEKNRMADWEIHAEMISRCMGNEPMKLIDAYNVNRELATGQALENSPVAPAIIAFMDDKDYWEGPTAELLAKLEDIATSILQINTARDKRWPKGAQVLTTRLAEVRVDLAEVGIILGEREHSGTIPKKVIIEKKPPKPPKPSKNTDDGDTENESPEVDTHDADVQKQ